MFKFLRDKLKKKVVIEEPIEETPEEISEKSLVDHRGDEILCSGCGLSILESQKVKTFVGKKYHRLCYKDLVKMAKKTSQGYS